MKVLQAEREKAKAENDSAFERLRVDMERHNSEQNAKITEQNAKITEQSAKITEQNTKMAEQDAKMEERSKEVIKFIATMSGVVVVSLSVILGGLIAFLQYFK